MTAGFTNVLLLAPVWMQLVHLLVADCLWIAYILMGARLLALGQGGERLRAPQLADGRS
jgi:cytochrome c oxidase assembly protein subunit 15